MSQLFHLRLRRYQPATDTVITGETERQNLLIFEPIDARFVGCPDIFTVHGPDVGRDAALVGAGVTIQVTPTFAVFGHYDGIVGRDNYNSYAVNGGLAFGF